MIIGHHKQWEFLKQSVKRKRLSHAYLFSGQSQLGKKTSAFRFIKLLFCEGKIEDKPCQICRPCRDVQKGIHPDFFFLGPKKKEIQISQIRDLNWKLALHPSLALLKAAIIDEAHSLNPEAQNSLLKTLEEPKGNAILILVTDRPQLLFPTIRSRVQKIRFFPVPKSEIENYLKKKDLGVKETQEITRFSFGKPGLAIHFLESEKALASQNQKIKEVLQLSKAELASRFQYVKDLIAQKQSIHDVLNIWLRYFRGILLEKIKGSSGPSQYSLTKLQKIIQTIERINFLTERTNINQRLALEQIMLEL